MASLDELTILSFFLNKVVTCIHLHIPYSRTRSIQYPPAQPTPHRPSSQQDFSGVSGRRQQQQQQQRGTSIHCHWLGLLTTSTGFFSHYDSQNEPMKHRIIHRYFVHNFHLFGIIVIQHRLMTKTRMIRSTSIINITFFHPY